MKGLRSVGVALLLLPLLVAAAPERPVPFAGPEGEPRMALPDDGGRYVGLSRPRLLTMARADPADLTCLAQTVYFEARGEPLAGQFAVAQVVLNRVADSRYPDNICDVVFQNEGWRHRCQFSFACDGRSDQPAETRAWLMARTVAAFAALEGARHTAGAATHYHAVYVRPGWADRLQRTAKLGRHVFYREGY